MPWLFTIIAQPLPAHVGALLTVALSALSISTVVVHAAACTRVDAIAIPNAM